DEENEVHRLAGVQQGTLPPDELGALLSEMDSPGGWRQALDRLDLPIMARKRFWFTDLKKSAFYKSIPGVKTKAVLDVGSGSGVIAEGLAGSFGQVVALERDPQ